MTGPQVDISTSRRRVDFWPGMSADLDLQEIVDSAVPVKGVAHHSPLRFLEIYANEDGFARTTSTPASKSSNLRLPEPTWEFIQQTFFPRIPGVPIQLGADVDQPPFAWREADAKYLAVSFTYNTNAFVRILGTLRDQGKIVAADVEGLLDRACILLSQLYRAHNYSLIRNINNNFNMYLISKVVEHLVGKKSYDADRQELDTTRVSLAAALELAPYDKQLGLLEKMGTALGRGVGFMESRIRNNSIEKNETAQVQDVAYQYYGRRLAIDHRMRLIEMVSNACDRNGSFDFAVILDDATETVGDLLWLQDLMEQFPGFRVHLLVNTAQISINFSEDMLKQVRRTPCFRSLFSRSGSQFFVVPMYCPFISFQTNYLPPAALDVIDKADAAYIKGANFFETCQIVDKDTFHAFVVFGPVSRLYTGLNDFDGVFAYLSAGTSGYRHAQDSSQVVTLSAIVGPAPPMPGIVVGNG
jgi:hypothetical protein